MQTTLCDGCKKSLDENEGFGKVEILSTRGGRVELHFHNTAEQRCFEDFLSYISVQADEMIEPEPEEIEDEQTN